MVMPAVAFMKLNLILHGYRGSTTPVLVCLVAPFLIKLAFGYHRLVRDSYSDLVLAARLFVFQLRQIADRAVSGEGGGRWERAVRLVHRRLSYAARPRGAAAMDLEESLRTLSMLTL